MAIYAIADLHLSFNNPKPMDIFGDNWKDHENKIKENWVNTVKEEDLVIIPGDFSWATYLEETWKDFKYLSMLPGKKILLKGNHDYWWSTKTKIDQFLRINDFKDISILHNNSFKYNDYVIVGTRGWDFEDKENINIIEREIGRLKLSFENATNKYGINNKFIVCFHYPPITKENISNEYEKKIIEIMKKYNVTNCIYGHLHGKVAYEAAILGIKEGIKFDLVSADYLNFKVLKLI